MSTPSTTALASQSPSQSPSRNPFVNQIVRRSLKIGPYLMRSVPTGVFGLDGGAMFGTVPKVLWEKSNPADDHNRIEMEARALLLDGGEGNRVLIDCGIGGDFIAKYGEKLGPKFAEIYAVNAASSSQSEPIGIVKGLVTLGLKPSDISHVVLTHLHFDHAGGATTVRDGQLKPTFPNARYFVQKANLATASNPNLRERASYYPANFQPLLDAGVLELLDGARENLLPGISVSVTDGHTVGQQVVRVSDGQANLLYCADLIPTSSHIRLAWVMGYDLEPLKLIEEKRQVLTAAARGGWHLFFEHDPYMDAAVVEEVKGDFAAKERVSFAN